MLRKISVVSKLSLACILFLAIFLCSLSAYAASPQGKVARTWGNIKANGGATPETLLAPRGKNQGTGESGDPAVLAMMHEMNEQLAAEGLDIAVEAIELFTNGPGRPANRLHQIGTRWVPSDPRRGALGDDITYLVDISDGATSSGLANAATEPAIDRAMSTWDASRALKKVDIVKRLDPGFDPDIVDAIIGFGDLNFGLPGSADIVHAGWLPLTPPLSPGTLAATFTFVFIDDGEFTDINGDNYLDTAFKEIYYNDLAPWEIDVPLPEFDVETVALHEGGHGLELDHFGPPPAAVMNGFYTGIRQSLLPPDKAGANAVWSGWPNP
jgi:hypothetical protein